MTAPARSGFVQRPATAGARPAGLTSRPTAGGTGSLAFSRMLENASRRASPSAETAASAASLRRIQGFNQANRGEYDSAEQASLWGGSTCSAAALVAVLRARGVRVRIADVMRAMPGGLTPELGLVSRPALVSAAARFGATTRDDVTNYDGIRRAVAAGQPVMVDITNDRFPAGHWLVVTAADETGVRVADSSGDNLTTIPRDEFLAAWSGRGIRVLDSPSRLAPVPQRRGF
ncbi:MAG: C39 family peptidase [Chloroflexi bacterium]|nr:C39 family peptidase [Chloroflexota bacterium]